MGPVTDRHPECGNGYYQHLSPRTGCHASLAELLCEQSGGRFLLGMGVSHKPLVEGSRPEYGPPVATMRAYLKKMAEAPYTAVMPEATPKTVIAALGPKMLELAASETVGAHPYFSSPDHTAMAENYGRRCLVAQSRK